MVLGATSIDEVVGCRASRGHPASDRARTDECTARSWCASAAVLWIVLFATLTFGASPVAAQNIGYFGKNRLTFAPVAPFLLPDAAGSGIVDYKGGKEPTSRWRASFRFTGLEPGASYTVAIRGRFGAQGSSQASAFTPLCSFEADVRGQGGCFWYFRGLARLTLVQLRAVDESGTRVVEAGRSRGVGSIETEPNRFSPGGEIPAHGNS